MIHPNVFMVSGRFGPGPRRRARTICLALVAGLGGFGVPSAQAMLPSPAAQVAAEAEKAPALGFASFAENSFLVLLAGRPCTACGSQEAKASCAHAEPATLVHYALEDDGQGGQEWIGKEVFDGPADLGPMQPGPGATLILSGPLGTLTRVHLDYGQGHWRAQRSELLLDLADRHKLGLPVGRFDRFAVGPDGALVLVYGRNVAWLPASAGGWAKDQVRWLQGQAPGESKLESAADPAPSGPLVAVDARGCVFVVDGQDRTIIRINPFTLEASKPFWPVADAFVPVSVACLGRTLHLAGREDAKAKATSLVGLISEGRTCSVERRVVPRELGAVLGTTREGHLLGASAGGLGFTVFRNVPAPAGEAKAERKTDARGAQAAADATYAALLEEEKAKDKLQRQKDKRRQSKARAAARKAQVEPDGAGTGPASRTLGVLTALRQHPSGFGLKPEPPAKSPAPKPAAAASPKPAAAAGAVPAKPAGAWAKAPTLAAPAKPKAATPPAAKPEAATPPAAKSEAATPPAAGAQPPRKSTLNPRAQPFVPEPSGASAIQTTPPA